MLQDSVRNSMELIWPLWKEVVVEMSDNQKLEWSWSLMRFLTILSGHGRTRRDLTKEVFSG